MQGIGIIEGALVSGTINENRFTPEFQPGIPVCQIRFLLTLDKKTETGLVIISIIN